jgi:hypothetical protein
MRSPNSFGFSTILATPSVIVYTVEVAGRPTCSTMSVVPSQGKIAKKNCSQRQSRTMTVLRGIMVVTAPGEPTRVVMKRSVSQ